MAKEIGALLMAALVSAAMAAGAEDPRGYAAGMAEIPAGSFRMGSEIGPADELPVRTVPVAAFSMGRTEVTLAWYLRCMADGACEPPSWWRNGYSETRNLPATPAAAMALPATGVSWLQAKAFCAWLGEGYDLPSEAEWEYAAGAGKGWIYPWGDRAEDRFAKVTQKKYLEPVASGEGSPLGLYDLGGSVWEWTLDCYEKPGADGHCPHRVSKGGSWSEHIWNLRVANRSYGFEDVGYKGVGFRVVRHAR